MLVKTNEDCAHKLKGSILLDDANFFVREKKVMRTEKK